jgi:hypothetical protein
VTCSAVWSTSTGELHERISAPHEVQEPATKRRCQRNSVSGLTKKHGQRPRGSTRLIAGEQRPVGGFQPGAEDLAAEDRELVAQHEDLQVLGGIAAGQQHEQLDGPAQRQVRQFR